jgi:hypothetical protein
MKIAICSAFGINALARRKPLLFKNPRRLKIGTELKAPKFLTHCSPFYCLRQTSLLTHNCSISGSDPTTFFYNAVVVKSYSATNTMARFCNKNIFL